APKLAGQRSPLRAQTPKGATWLPSVSVLRLRGAVDSGSVLLFELSVDHVVAAARLTRARTRARARGCARPPPIEALGARLALALLLTLAVHGLSELVRGGGQRLL